MKFKNYTNKHTKSNRIFSEDDIWNMKLAALVDNENDILAQNEEIGIPTSAELQSSPNVIWIDSYTRDDGTKVEGHWRSLPDGNSSTGAAANLSQNNDSTSKADKLYPEEIAGVKRGKEKTFLQMMQQGVNPQYMSENDKNDDYSRNCQSCVVAAELVIRGYDVEAGPYSTPEAKSLSKRFASAYLDPVTGEECSPELIYGDTKNCYDYINKTIKQNERYEFAFNLTPDKKWELTESHIVLITRDNNNKLLVYDPQDGNIAYDVEAKLYIESQLNKYNKEYEPALLRVDDKIPNPFYTNKVVKKRQKY